MMGSAPETSDLPDGWDIASFGDLNSFRGGTVNPAARPDDVFELYSVPSFPTRRPEQLPGHAIGSTKQAVSPGDVLVCKINPRINRVWTVGPRSDHEQIASSEWIGFRSDALVPRFAMHYFSEPSFRSLLCSEVSGVGGSLTRAQPSRVAEYPVPVAPLAEQTRIADQLDTLLARIQACQVRLEAIPALLTRFRQLVLGAAVGGRLTSEWRAKVNAQAWRSTTFGQQTVSSYYGPRFGKDDYTRSSSGIPTVRTTDMDRAGRIHVTDETPRVLVPSEKLEQYIAKPGDLLITRTGSIGVMAVFEGDYQAIPSAYLIRFRFDAGLRPRYAYYRLASPKGQAELGLSSTAVAQPNVNAEAIKRIALELPSVEEQDEIIHRVEALLSAAEQIEAKLRAASTQTGRLASLTLAKAFRGELVPQDPGDEPASALLARIIAQRNAPADASAAPTTRRGRPPRAPKETATMTKSRQDVDVMGQPYLAAHLRRLGAPVSAQALFKVAELPVADFYKQLAWEVDQGHVVENQTSLEPGHAAG